MSDSLANPAAALKAVPAFSALGEAEIAELCRQCVTRQYKAGQIILHSLQEADWFFVVLSGQVKVYKVSAKGDEQILHLYGPGQTFGEAAMWAGIRFPANAEAVRDARLLVVPRPVLRRAIEKSPDVAMGMLAGLSAKLREFNQLIEDLSLKEVPARLARVLLEESERHGTATFRLRQTKRQLAAQIGTVAETLSRTLGKLKAAGLIDVAGSKITIRNAQGLRDLAEKG